MDYINKELSKSPTTEVAQLFIRLIVLANSLQEPPFPTESIDEESVLNIFDKVCQSFYDTKRLVTVMEEILKDKRVKNYPY